MDTLALILSIVGCLNWGLVGIFKFDLVAWLFGGQGSLFSRLVYTVVGLAGLWCVSSCSGETALWKANNSSRRQLQRNCRLIFLL